MPVQPGPAARHRRRDRRRRRSRSRVGRAARCACWRWWSGDGPAVAIVTGGSSGIGDATCRAMIEAGFEVVSLALDAPGWTHPRMRAVTVDLTDAATTRAVAETITARYEVSHLVHAAGVIRARPLEQATSDDLHALTALHLQAPLLLAQAVLPGMRARRFGRVVLISSRAAMGLATRTAYSATKAGLIGMARTVGAGTGAGRHHRQRGRTRPDRGHADVPRRGAGGRRAGKRAGREHPGRAAGTAGRRGAGGDVLRRSRQRRSSPAKRCSCAAAQAWEPCRSDATRAPIPHGDAETPLRRASTGP